MMDADWVPGADELVILRWYAKFSPACPAHKTFVTHDRLLDLLMAEWLDVTEERCSDAGCPAHPAMVKLRITAAGRAALVWWDRQVS
jgi:hypothetical protein